jgi:hypothetical protein
VRADCNTLGVLLVGVLVCLVDRRRGEDFFFYVLPGVGFIEDCD